LREEHKLRTELRDESILIRRYRAEDIPSLFEAARESISDTFTRWMPWCHANYTMEESSDFVLSRKEAWDKGEEYDFAVFDLATATYLGGVGLNQFNRSHGLANLGYWVRGLRMGRGIAVAATLLAARFGFEDLGLNRIEIIIAVENKRSQRVAEKARAQREGVLRSRLLIADRLHDAVMYSIVAADLNT
jgi:ribosomal-protein-serine acetyltransferase